MLASGDDDAQRGGDRRRSRGRCARPAAGRRRAARTCRASAARRRRAGPPHRARRSRTTQAPCRRASSAASGWASAAPYSRRVSSSRYVVRVAGGRLHHRLVDQRREHRGHGRPRDVAVAADPLGGVEVERAGEGRQAPEQLLGRRFEQLVRPVDERAQRAVPLVGDPAGAGEQAEAVAEPFGDLGRGRASGSAPRPARWPAARRRGAGTARPRRRSSPRRRSGAGWRPPPAAGTAPRPARPRTASRSASASATGSVGTLYTVSCGSPAARGWWPARSTAGHAASSRSTNAAMVSSTCSQLSSTSSSGPVAEQVQHRLLHRASLLGLHAELGGDRGHDAGLVAHRRQLDHGQGQARAVRDPAGGPTSQLRLADATRPDQGDQAASRRTRSSTSATSPSRPMSSTVLAAGPNLGGPGGGSARRRRWLRRRWPPPVRGRRTRATGRARGPRAGGRGSCARPAAHRPGGRRGAGPSSSARQGCSRHGWSTVRASASPAARSSRPRASSAVRRSSRACRRSSVSRAASGSDPRLVGELGERLAPPLGQRLVEVRQGVGGGVGERRPTGGQGRLEAVDVGRRGRDDEPVPGRLGHQPGADGSSRRSRDT